MTDFHALRVDSSLRAALGKTVSTPYTDEGPGWGGGTLESTAPIDAAARSSGPGEDRRFESAVYPGDCRKSQQVTYRG